MTKDKDTKTVVPALRFPEFRDGEGWIPNKIDHVCKIGNGRDYKHLSAGNIPVYGSGGYMTSVDKFLYDGESVCIGRKGTIDKPIFLTGKFWTVDTLFYTYAFYKCLPKFLYLIFQQINWHKYNEAGGVPSLLKTTIGNINIFIPNNESEQKKIVDCFSCLDDLISAVADKIETLKEYKKGLMQQLFPVEGKTIPAIRFPEFQNAGEWQTVSLGDVATFINGRAFKQDELLESGKYRVLRVGNFFSNAYWYHSDLELDENKYCDKGDLLYAWSASFGPRIWNEDKVIFHYHIWKVVEKEGISKDFLLILLDYETEQIKNQQANGLGLL
ncbi:restriction endonuclease subunit S, partial [uncultured Parabacteroides sp.]|uniref:restriction endonuclease subunit S n=1 Tax=uncultured Parabacteroides sp. TaxID=512312 RepID=UPI002665D7C1